MVDPSTSLFAAQTASGEQLLDETELKSANKLARSSKARRSPRPAKPQPLPPPNSIRFSANINVVEDVQQFAVRLCD
jgi:hypothetical protein